MRADLRGHVDAAVFAPADQLHRSARAHVTEMDMARGPAREQDVADRHDLLGLRWNALEAEARAHDASVHRAAFRERWLLAVIGHWNPKCARVLEGRAHQVCTRDWTSVVADGDGAGGDHLAELGERLTALANRDRADGVDARRLCARRLTDDEPDCRLVIRHRIGVWHRADRGEPTGSCRSRTGCDRLHFLAAWLAQVTMDVDE